MVRNFERNLSGIFLVFLLFLKHENKKKGKKQLKEERKKGRKKERKKENKERKQRRYRERETEKKRERDRNREGLTLKNQTRFFRGFFGGLGWGVGRPRQAFAHPKIYRSNCSNTELSLQIPIPSIPWSIWQARFFKRHGELVTSGDCTPNPSTDTIPWVAWFHLSGLLSSQGGGLHWKSASLTKTKNDEKWRNCKHIFVYRAQASAWLTTTKKDERWRNSKYVFTVHGHRLDKNDENGQKMTKHDENVECTPDPGLRRTLMRWPRWELSGQRVGRG